MVETRRLTAAAELRAMAHPLRLRLVEELGLDGPLTATELAERVDESPSNLSWHLRQLAKHGYVEEVDAPGRRRPWRLTSISHSWGEELDADARPAAAALNAIVERHDLDARHEYQLRESSEPPEWQSATFGTSSAAWLTAEELAEVGRAFSEILAAYSGRILDPETRPVGARPARIVFWGHPLRAADRDPSIAAQPTPEHSTDTSDTTDTTGPADGSPR